VPTKSPLTEASRPNDVWCADFKGHFFTGNGDRCCPLTITDKYSRSILCCQHADKMNLKETKKIFEKAFKEYGLPKVIRTDNGTPFSSGNRYGISELNLWWIRLGIHPERIKPGRPDQNGQHERMHRDLKEDTARPPASTIKNQQKKFDWFVQMYNFERPHEALGMNVPSSRYVRSDRAFPPCLSKIEYAEHIKAQKVSHSGAIKLRGRVFFVSKCLRRQLIGIDRISEEQYLIWYCNYQLGVLDLSSGIIIPNPCIVSSNVSLKSKEL